MKKFKNILAMGLATCMAFSMAGCGNSSSKNNETKDSEKAVEEKLSFSTALSEISAINEGKYTLVIKSDKSNADVSGRFNGKDFTVDKITSKTGDKTMDMTDVFVASGDNFYFDISSFLGTMTSADETNVETDDMGAESDTASDIDMSSMIYYIPRPTIAEDDMSAFKTKINGLFSDMLVESTKDVTVNADENSVSVDISTPEGMKSFINGSFDYVISHESDVNGIITDAKNLIDFEAYADKILDSCYDELAPVLGSKSKDEFKAALKSDVSASVKTDEINDIAKKATEAKERFNKLTDEEYDAQIGNASYVKFTVKRSGSDSYTIDFDINIQPNKTTETDSTVEAASALPSIPSITSVSTTAGHMSGSITITKQSVDEIKVPENAKSVASLIQMFIGSSGSVVDNDESHISLDHTRPDSSSVDN